MKKSLLTAVFMTVSVLAVAQNNPINFEAGGQGASWTWTVFENGNNPAVEIIDNPDKTGLNTSNKVAKFTALAAGQPWAGAESSKNGADLGNYVISSSNSIVKIMVWKSVISPVGIKFATTSGWAQQELKVSNTKVNQWEELTFDFSTYQNPPAAEGVLNQFIIFPDFGTAARTADQVVYFDNVTFSAKTGGVDPNAPIAFCNTPVTHFGIAAETASAIKMSVYNSGANSMIVQIESANNDPADLLIVNEVTGSPAIGETVNQNGKLSRTLTWSGAPPADVMLNVLWSKVSSPGNWQLAQNTVKVAFSATCETTNATAPTAGAPVPMFKSSGVISVFSNSYSNIAGTDLNPGWGQATVTTQENIAGNNTLKLAGLNYQGIQLGSAQNVTAMTHVYLNFWTVNATQLQVFLISPGPVETPVTLQVPTTGWATANIPLTSFAPVALNNVIQFKFVGNGDVYLDNILFNNGELADPNGEAPALVNFEPNGAGADWKWTTFENASNPAVEIIANPNAAGINTSATVAKITALQAGQPWAGARSVAKRYFTFNAATRTVKMMVWKSVISDVGLKLETASNWAQPEVKVANTKVNEWEELTFTFTGRDLPPGGEAFNGISIFPDFKNGRTADEVMFFDNISFTGFAAGGEILPPAPVGPPTAAPSPTYAAANVIPIFSDVYTNVAGTNFNPGWGQATVSSIIEVEGNKTLSFAGLNYQGIEIGSAVNLTAMTHLHLNFWTENSTALEVFIISPGPVEKAVPLTVPTNGWATAKIPLSSFDPVALNNVFQFKFVGNGTVYLDNILFYKDEPTSNEDGSVKAPGFVLNQNFPNPFNPSTVISYSLNSASKVTLEVFNLQGQKVATLVNQVQTAGSHAVPFNAAGLASGVYMYRLTAGGVSRMQKMMLIK